jgi:hypothetical protein
MQFKTISILIALAISVLASGCGTATTPNANAGNFNAANTAAANANNPLETSKKPEAATTNNAPTFAPVVAAYYDALKKKDDAAMRKVLSQDLIKDIEADMKEEKKTSIASYLAEIDQVPETPVEVRNETISGEKGIAEVRGGAYPNWTKLAFVNEGGTWKLSNESPEVESVEQGSNSKPSNAVK